MKALRAIGAFIGRALVLVLLLLWIAVALVAFTSGVFFWIFVVFPFREGSAWGEQVRKYMAAIGTKK